MGWRFRYRRIEDKPMNAMRALVAAGLMTWAAPVLAHHAFEHDKANNVLVMGPWIHGGWNFTSGASLGPVMFGSNTAEYYREKVELPFFNYHLKGKRNWKPVNVLSFETGTNRWREYQAWPPKGTKPMRSLSGARTSAVAISRPRNCTTGLTRLPS